MNATLDVRREIAGEKMNGFLGGDILVVNLNKRPQKATGVLVFIRRKRTPDVGGHCRGIAIFPATSNEGLLAFFPTRFVPVIRVLSHLDWNFSNIVRKYMVENRSE